MYTLEEEQSQADKTAFEESRKRFVWELSMRRVRHVRFCVHHYTMENYLWQWMIGRCRKWEEVERVLNLHKVDWDRKEGRILSHDFEIYRCN